MEKKKDINRPLSLSSHTDTVGIEPSIPEKKKKQGKASGATKKITKGQATGEVELKDGMKSRSVQECIKHGKFHDVVSSRGFSSRATRLESPRMCQTYILEYFQWCDDNPVLLEDYVRSGAFAGQSIPFTRRRARTLKSFCLFIGWSTKEFYAKYNEFVKVGNDAMIKSFDLIVDLIESDSDIGALSGTYDQNYMAKLRGLKDSKDVTSKGEKITTSLSVNVLSKEAADKLKLLDKLTELG